MKNIPLHFKIIIGLILGIIWAFIASFMQWNSFTINWIDPFGTIFIRLLKFIAIPLVIFSIISGIASLNDVSKLGKLGLKTISIYMLTTVIAVLIGLLLVNTIKPGDFVDEQQRIKNRISYEIWVKETEGVDPKDDKRFLKDPKYQSLVNEVIEQNNLQKLNEEQVSDKIQVANQKKDESPLMFFVEIVPENLFFSISNNQLMLQVIFFAIFFGVSLVFLPNDQTETLIKLINDVNTVFLNMVGIIMKAAPFFVFCLLAGVIAKMANTPAEVWEIFKGLGSYTITLTIGLCFMIFVFYPLIITSVLKKMTYHQFFKNIAPAQFLAFSTSSSAATLPVTMDCVNNNMKVPKNISSFVLPIGATVNMDGTSMMQGVAVIFMAQLHMVDLTLIQQITIVFTATLASIGAAAVPSAGLIMMIIVLQSVGLNPAWIAIIFPVDRILDMTRTVVNVTGDIVVASIVAKSENEIE